MNKCKIESHETIHKSMIIQSMGQLKNIQKHNSHKICIIYKYQGKLNLKLIIK